jgi:hypothetical protein
VQGLWHQIDAPLQFILRTWWFHLQKTPLSLRTALHQRPPPVVDMAALWPAQRARVMFSLTAMTCHQMSTAPGKPCQWPWKTSVFSRVMAGYLSKIQVRLAAAVQKLVLLILLTALQQTQAELTNRIKGRPGIDDAAASGNAGLVLDHIVADPATVHAKDILYVICL